jgi:hydroxyethylthiazole kinase
MEKYMIDFDENISKILSKIQKVKPLIHNITNYVVMNDTANILLHVGALPVMAHAKEEMKEMVAIADALVINIGTLSSDWVEAMIVAGKAANKKGIPVILDSVGAGATSYRTLVCKKFLSEFQITVLKGNEGEIGILTGAGGKVKGVESIGGSDNLISSMLEFAKNMNLTLVVTGKRDIVTNGKMAYGVDNGDINLTKITGTGCMSTAVLGAFCAVENNFFEASVESLALFGLCGEIAARKAQGPASFKIEFLDTIYKIAQLQNITGSKIAVIKTNV